MREIYNSKGVSIFIITPQEFVKGIQPKAEHLKETHKHKGILHYLPCSESVKKHTPEITHYALTTPKCTHTIRALMRQLHIRSTRRNRQSVYDLICGARQKHTSIFPQGKVELEEK